MRKLITSLVLMATFSLMTAQAQQTQSFSADQMPDFLKALKAAVDGDVFVLTTPGDQGYYKVDSTCLEIYADVTIKAAADLAVKPKIKLVYNEEYDDAADTSMVDYLVRFMEYDVALTLYGLELQGDTANVKYCIRTRKIADVTGDDSYLDATWNEDSIVQYYDLTMVNCDMNGIKSGSDGRGLMLYVGTRGNITIDNCTFSAMERDAINMYTDGDRTTANGPFKYVDMITIKNSTFYNLGREAITYRNSGEDATDPANKSRASKIYIDHCIFDSVGQGSTTDSYYCLRTDPAQLMVTNCIFSNQQSEDYIIRNNNSDSRISDCALVNIYKEVDGAIVEWDNVEDAVDFEDESRTDETIYLNTLDPMYADRTAGDFTYGAAATTLAMGNDGKDLGDLRWSADWVDAANADLAAITVNGTAIEDFSADVTSYTVILPSGTTEVPEVMATTFSPDASYTAVTPTTLPGTMEFTVTSADGFITKAYEVFMYVGTGVNENTTDILSIYPNPSTGTFTVANNPGANLTIYDVTGKVVLSKNSISNNELIVVDLSKGVYFVTAQNGDETNMSKIVIE
jgi:hypothetical protein